jgi:argininosuccinate lyase
MITVLHERIEETAGFVFPGYTYGQQAQPTTMGHHLLGIAAPFFRDLERIIACVDRFNRNPLGAAALCGSSYPIDRELTARLLGFDGVWEHTEDAVVSADYMLEASNAALMSLVTQARLAEDIIYWCSNEVGFADLPNDLIDSSSIMPQKRNPVICATVRAQARIYAGRYAGICAASSVEYYASRDVTVAWGDVLEIVREATGMCLIGAEYTKGLIFKKEAMERMLYKGFSNATELADSLVMQGGLPFRVAHTIVGGAISQLFNAGEGQDELTWDLLNAWSKKVAGRDLPLSKEQVAQAKNFRVDVERRACQGGTALKEIRRMLDLQRQAKAGCETQLAKRREQWKAADALLRKQVLEIADGK